MHAVKNPVQAGLKNAAVSAFLAVLIGVMVHLGVPDLTWAWVVLLAAVVGFLTTYVVEKHNERWWKKHYSK